MTENTWTGLCRKTFRRMDRSLLTMNREKLLELIDDGLMEAREAVIMCVLFMGEDDTALMMDKNELSERFTRED